MTTLKGQNLRILVLDEGSSDWNVIAMSTNCTITMDGNADNASTKDDIGMFDKPEITSKSWSIQTESLYVGNAAMMLRGIKLGQKFTVMWTEVSTDDNKTALEGDFARQGEVIINDLTLNFNDRENSTHQLQMTGVGPIVSQSDDIDVNIDVANVYTKGQFVRLFTGVTYETASATHILAYAKQLQVHVSCQLEDATTKDTTGDWTVQEVTGITFDITTNALVRSGERITSLAPNNELNDFEYIYQQGLPVKFDVANVSGDNNRTKGLSIMSGQAVITNLVLNAPNRQTATYNMTLRGYGSYTA